MDFLNNAKMGLFRSLLGGALVEFLITYLLRGIFLSILGGALATAGLGVGIISAVFFFTVLQIDYMALFNYATESAVRSPVIQLISLMFTSVLFLFVNSLFASVPAVPAFRYSGLTSLGKVIKSLFRTAIPLSIIYVMVSMSVLELFYLGGDISLQSRNTLMVSNIILPMIFFYQVGVEKLSM